MKTMIQTLALVVIGLSIFAGNSNATSLHPDTFSKKAELLTWNLAKDSFLSNKKVEGGVVKVNAVTKTVTIVFDLANNCPPHAFCFAYIPNYTLELPIVSITKDSCGVVTYVAEKNLMPVDGGDEKLVINDNSASLCEIVYPAHTTINYSEKFYDRQHGKLVAHSSYLTADQLL